MLFLVLDLDGIIIRKSKYQTMSKISGCQIGSNPSKTPKETAIPLPPFLLLKMEWACPNTGAATTNANNQESVPM